MLVPSVENGVTSSQIFQYTKSLKNSRPEVHISYVAYTDVPTLTRIFLLAFAGGDHEPALQPHRAGLTTAELLSLEGPPEERRMKRGLVEKNIFVKASIRKPDLHDPGAEEKIVGWAKWSGPPGVRRRSIWDWIWAVIIYPLHRVLFRPKVSPGLPPQAREMFNAQCALTFGPGGVAEGRSHWHLHCLCVDPDWQGLGIGGALMDWGMKRAKEDNAVVYLESSPAGLPVYLSKGFRVVADQPCYINGLFIQIPGLLWEPKANLKA